MAAADDPATDYANLLEELRSGLARARGEDDALLNAIWRKSTTISSGTVLNLSWDTHRHSLSWVAGFNRASDRQPWAPLDTGPTLSLDNIVIDPRTRSAGLGRALINVLTQSVTRNTRIPQRLWIDMCHFPLFFTIDSFYGWVRTELRDPGTNPGLIYPRYYPNPTPEQKLENKKATLAYTNLLWYTPLEVALARVDAAYPWLRPRLEPILRALNAGLATITTTANYVTVEGLVGVAPLERALGGGREALARAVAAHCRELGYSDPTGATVMALVLSLGLLSNTLAPSGPSAAACAQMILAFLIDHGRVLYRPLVLADGLVSKLCRACNVDSPQELLRATDPWHAPHFEELEPEGRWLWVPIKKPHSGTYDGTRYIAPPANEDAPMFVAALTSERPTKKQRTKLDCLHCGAAVAHVAERANQVAFCDRACSLSYYNS